jgi:preprotein translocase subunit SecF
MDDFFGKDYKKYMIIPLIVLIPLLFSIFIFPGVDLGIDITGGNLIILRSEKELTSDNITNALSEFDLPELSVSTIASPTGYGAWIQYSKNETTVRAEELITNAEVLVDNEEESIAYSNQVITLLGGEEQDFENSRLAVIAAQDALLNYKEEFYSGIENSLTEELGLGENAEFQQREVSPTLGAASFAGILNISIIGFILLTLVVFIAFRQLIPSLAIIQAMIFDIIAGLAGMAILNIPLSLTTLPALLLLVGYSVDTDIMLTSRLLKERSGTNGERATSSMKTGLTMTITTLAALISMITISYFYQIEVIYNISAILLFGLIGDLISTWLFNAPILLWFVERDKK